MEIQTIITGMLRENCYVITKDGLSLVIDPGDDFDKIKETIKDKKVVGILITHRHFDHVGALKELEDYLGMVASLKVKGFDYEIISTPGHTDDSLSYYFKSDGCMFTGDFLFKGTIGRMDLPTGSVKDMKNSLDKMASISDGTVIYPGHGPSTTLGAEKPYFEDYISF